MPFSGCFVGANPKVWASSTRKKTFLSKKRTFYDITKWWEIRSIY